MSKLKELLNNFSHAMENELGFVIAVVIFVAVLFALAIIAEKTYHKSTVNQSNVSKTKKITIIGAFSALAAVLMYFEIPLFFAPSFYKIDFSEIPVLICGFLLGPVSAASSEAIKIIIKLIIHPTSTAFVGEFANFVVGCAFVIPASIIYQRHKTRKRAVIGMVSGTLISTATGMFTNAFILLPAFAVLYGGMPVSALISMGTEVNSAINGMFTFILLAVTPLNLVKFGLVSVVVFLIYKKISVLLKMTANDIYRVGSVENKAS
jgi:riboflavin transporter FmnP